MSSLSALRDLHASLSRENSTKIGARDTVIAMANAKVEAVKELNAKQQSIADCILLVQKFSEGLQSGVVQRFEDLLTRGIRTIFNKDYIVSIEFATSGNTLNADFFITLPDGKKVNLAKGEGGGMRDMVAVLQRVLYIILEPSHPARILFMDEDLKMLDSERAPAAFEFIRSLTAELDIQVVWITHQQSVRDSIADDTGIKLLALS